MGVVPIPVAAVLSGSAIVMANTYRGGGARCITEAIKSILQDTPAQVVRPFQARMPEG